jgi:hypothetical protein
MAVAILRKEDAMRISRITVSSEAVGTVRSGFSGAKTVLVEENGRFEIRFFSSSGRLKNSVQVKEGVEYVIGPDFIKQQVPLNEDNYWPRRWAREKGGISHLSYFEILDDGQEFELPIIRGRKDEPWRLACPESIKRLSIKPINGFGYGKCLVSRSWLEKASYAEFCSAMQDENLYRRCE